MTPLWSISTSDRPQCSGFHRYVATAMSFVGFLFLLSACGTVEKVSQEEIKSRYAKLTTEQAMELTVKRYNSASNEDYNYYSPQNWQLATAALAKAQEISSKDKNNQEIYKQVFLVDRRIDSARYIKDRVLNEFADLFKSKKILQKNNAPLSFNAQYKENASRLASLIKDFESYTLGTASNVENIRTVNIDAQKLLKSMQVLNIKVVKHNYLDGAIARLKTMEASEARSVAPQSFQQALDALKAANEFIEKDVHNTTGVESVAEKFTFSVSHLEHVLGEIIALSKMDQKQLEQVILSQEQNLQQIGKALNGLDVRNLPLSMQAESVIKTANNVLDHHAEKSTMIVELTEKNLQLENQLNKRVNNDEGANAKLKSKIKLLEIDIQGLEKEQEKLKEDLFALQQKNIDLAIQNAKLLGDLEDKQGKFKAGDNAELGHNQETGTRSHSFIKASEPTRTLKTSRDREQARY